MKRLLLVALLLGWGVGAPAQAGGAPRESSRLLGDPGGARSRLETLGLSIDLFYNQFVGWKPRGGAHDGNVGGSSGSYDLFILGDLEELVGLRGLDVLVQAKGQYDRNVNGDVGALSDPVDDADFDEPIYVSQVSLRKRLLEERLTLRAGLLEFQTVFDRNRYANSEDRQFLSTFLDNDPLVPLPNSLGLVLIYRPLPWLEMAMGFADADNVPRRAGFDTAFDDLEGLTEYLEVTAHARLPGWGPGSYRAGVVRDGRDRTVFGRNRKRRGAWGGYLSFDQVVLQEGDAGEGLGVFARASFADGDVSQSAWFWSCGLQYRGLLPGRASDVLGLGAYQAIASGRFRDVDPDFDRETGLELYYAIDLLSWLAVTPDLQYIVNPGGREGVRDALVAVMRFRVAF